MVPDLSRIRLLLLDVDGVLTDGRVIIDNNGVEAKAFNIKDGHGMKLIQRAGIRVGIITGRSSQVVEFRARELGIDILHQGAKDKLTPYRQILAAEGLTDAEVAYVGDDLIDLPILQRVGYAVAVADAVAEIKPYVDYVTQLPGGYGAVREVCDQLLRGRGAWEDVTRRYFAPVDGGS